MTRVNKITAGNDSAGNKLLTALMAGMLAVAVAGSVSPVAGDETPDAAAVHGTSPSHLVGGPDDWPWRAV
jgi:hypothetical protein